MNQNLRMFSLRLLGFLGCQIVMIERSKGRAQEHRVYG